MILFLDFDGVLHPEMPNCCETLFCRLPLFESVMREFPSVDIVISSTWRESRTLDQLRGLFSTDIGSRIIDVTHDWRDLPNLVSVIGQYPRHVEIEGWLRQHERIWETWVALDDRPYLFRPFLDNLIKVDPAVGFDESIQRQLIEKLQRS